MRGNGGGRGGGAVTDHQNQVDHNLVLCKIGCVWEWHRGPSSGWTVTGAIIMAIYIVLLHSKGKGNSEH